MSRVRAHTIRPMTRSAMVVERIAAETGHSAAAIIRHIGNDGLRYMTMRMLCSFMFDDWTWQSGQTGESTVDPGRVAEKWDRFRDRLLQGIGEKQNG